MTREELIAALKEVPRHIYCRNDPTREILLRLTVAAAVIALTPRTCGTCRHYDPDHGADNRQPFGFCTTAVSWHFGRSMPPGEGCTQWEAAREDEDAV